MILYSLPISNYSGKVLHAIRFKDLECEVLPPPGGYGSDEFKKTVASGTIPALDHDGIILSESEVINEYLNEIHPEPNLLPGSLENRASIRMLCRFHDLKLEPIVRSLFPAMSPDKRDSGLVEKRFEDMNQALKYLRNQIRPNPFLMGDSPSLADCAYSQTLMLAQMMWDELGSPLALGEELEHWQNMMAGLDPVKSVLEPAREATGTWLAGKRDPA
ncbi:MAG: glutathione S-transferase family protein [SAR324 cluster bacterium]|jgi:glutathione S-transferase|nr:hypothetical protein [Deltaproteobacteria bacterium]MDP6092408.1 glutathione S-transferase family protein [SAR324 cluster bacterium]MDP7139520.1 glutathione S-transferase family protein [SAR324 cluster bacterium]MDP7498919.1 glutathione S-transferase family protein [SAR324 cluster bacterium]MEE1576757.1 glutathione S-transferase family protein [Deltaproteobacteria bacterium]|tara:strand:+ start:1932 stop:2582 length:651 start_codon:yes stop_codon:yes gene_type:complete